MPVFQVHGDTNTLLMPGDPLHPNSPSSRKRHRYTFKSSQPWEYVLDDSLQASM